MLALTGSTFAKDGVFVFVLMSSAGKIGGAGGPALFGLLGGVFDAPFLAGVAGAMNLTTQQAGLRLALLICALFPLISFILQVIISKSSHCTSDIVARNNNNS